MDRPWSVICGDLDRATGRRFPPVVGGGRGYVMQPRSSAVDALEQMLHDPVIMEGLPRVFAEFSERVFGPA